MSTAKTTLAAIVATLLLALTPAVNAQSPEDLKTMQTFLSIMDSYFGIIESTYAVASDHEKSAIMQMQKIQEVYEQRGQKAQAADILRNVLKDSRNTTIRNAAYMLLADNLKDTGRGDEALKLLEQGLRENITATQ